MYAHLFELKDKELIRKYLNGDCSFEEEQYALNTLSNDKGLEILNELADEFWDGELESEVIDSKKLYNKVCSNINWQRTKIWTYIGYAACFVLLIVGSLLITQLFSHRDEQIAEVEVEMVMKSTSRGQKSTIILSDGSKVILNSLSSISYAKHFTDSSRDIKLSGEAFFYVAKDKKRPFTVNTHKTKTTALGTSFNINTRAEHKISLSTGKVLINTINEDVFILEPGESLEVNENSGRATKGRFNIDKGLSWKDGVLYFNDTQFANIVNALELWYDVKIELTNTQVKPINYTGHFDNASLRHVLETMSFALNFKYALNDKKVIINFNQKP